MSPVDHSWTERLRFSCDGLGGCNCRFLSHRLHSISNVLRFTFAALEEILAVLAVTCACGCRSSLLRRCLCRIRSKFIIRMAKPPNLMNGANEAQSPGRRCLLNRSSHFASTQWPVCMVFYVLVRTLVCMLKEHCLNLKASS